MRKNMFKEITTTTITAATMDYKKGELHIRHLDPVTIVGKTNEEKAIKIMEKASNVNYVKIISLDEKTSVYEMLVSDFMKYAKQVDPATEAGETVE